MASPSNESSRKIDGAFGNSIMRVPAYYKGAHAIVAAPGPSLTKDVVKQIKSVKNKYAIIGVGDVYRRIDFLDELYACDAKWWKIHGPKITELKPSFRSWCYDTEGETWGAIKIEGVHRPGFSTDRNKIHFGSNSGYQTLNLCYHWGFTKMILVGFNMRQVGGKTHFFEGREQSLATLSPYNKFVEAFKTIQPEIKDMIVNCTPNSALTGFRTNDLEKELDL